MGFSHALPDADGRRSAVAELSPARRCQRAALSGAQRCAVADATHRPAAAVCPLPPAPVLDEGGGCADGV